ncbi:MAG: hypothetical protein EWV91_21130 [Microcystis aeruginosa Ma_QC_Ca_00000000_S207]|jgi:vacuolar-type H+-ATPase subunit F/Vma7|uniref:Uncharacterized protein n=2 Tax=Microcystis aeruginosa TaxID=1126 RepID=A0A552F4Q6_MICAE|nr:hypothetical protein [Microcystis aeruginosa W13-11]NCS76409.1 hypothetical protein [Microcystis aeruginosa K13-07]RPH91202.1 MAG: hypothetical protein EHM73_03625 [Chroococcales cyanobacterium metabat2.561]TRT77622.1 MAG: hypothetical protein EWV82_19130 [Microcystis aeruginosa Ma_AC_P_19900807_S299]TRU24709.1 MAG: hypothetical protein EWV81_13535 [Microcystis aeruginosa Ma_SC_T_19800800_S464]TRU41699.1 MAG: hypothetical protein EWV91_21130 [Microcystis aeruginosa Ma_QC_Ca_00000000_S207]
MKAYEFQTTINKGIVEIPSDYLRDLEKDQDVRVILLTEDGEAKKQNDTEKMKSKLSEFLLLPELEEDEILFERDKDTGREIF